MGTRYDERRIRQRSALGPRNTVGSATADSAADTPQDATRDTSPGHVEHDSRGNGIWRWHRAEGDSTSILLKRLDNDELRLEPTRPVPILRSGRSPTRRPAAADPSRTGELELEDTASASAGFDPYNRS